MVSPGEGSRRRRAAPPFVATGGGSVHPGYDHPSDSEDSISSMSGPGSSTKGHSQPEPAPPVIDIGKRRRIKEAQKLERDREYRRRPERDAADMGRRQSYVRTSGRDHRHRAGTPPSTAYKAEETGAREHRHRHRRSAPPPTPRGAAYEYAKGLSHRPHRGGRESKDVPRGPVVVDLPPHLQAQPEAHPIPSEAGEGEGDSGVHATDTDKGAAFADAPDEVVVTEEPPTPLHGYDRPKRRKRASRPVDGYGAEMPRERPRRGDRRKERGDKHHDRYRDRDSKYRHGEGDKYGYHHYRHGEKYREGDREKRHRRRRTTNGDEYYFKDGEVGATTHASRRERRRRSAPEGEYYYQDGDLTNIVRDPKEVGGEDAEPPLAGTSDETRRRRRKRQRRSAEMEGEYRRERKKKDGGPKEYLTGLMKKVRLIIMGY
ncbi:hypothetical protein MKZ38_008475 [Zalerion maritima]|uniref:Uncharacterized protein n=1 Tax=Zalerion maritima TaxID=339359 RepID=A0AAD5RU89_9PEZI|nr:hypothetical protein MKZ38_008475 [Zalerion maritima]